MPRRNKQDSPVSQETTPPTTGPAGTLASAPPRADDFGAEAAAPRVPAGRRRAASTDGRRRKEATNLPAIAIYPPRSAIRPTTAHFRRVTSLRRCKQIITDVPLTIEPQRV